MFNEDFYPTPRPVIDHMIAGIDLAGKDVLEPSAGKGDIVDVVTDLGGKPMVYEKHKDLAKIVSSKAKFMGYDFLEATPIDVSHADVILMNPPFSQDEKHIIHAFNIAPTGCEIVALCATSSIDKYSRLKSKQHLLGLIKNYGYSEDLGDVFKGSERKTFVDVSLVRMVKPGTKGKDEWAGFLDDEEDTSDRTTAGLMPYNEIRDIVERYMAAVNMFDEVSEASSKINSISSIFKGHNRITFGAVKAGDNYASTIDRDTYKKELQKSAWLTVFNKLKMDRFITSSVMEKLNRFVEKEQEKPFTVKNVRLMVSAIVQTTEANMKESVVSLFHELTKHTHDNRWKVEGWKTNESYLLGQKIIVPYITERGWDGEMKIRYQSRYNIDDLCKALCFFTGRNYDEIGRLDQLTEKLSTPITDPAHYDTPVNRKRALNWYNDLKWRHNIDEKYTEEEFIEKEIVKLQKECKDSEPAKWGTWYDWGFFEVKGFKKGTMHFKFKDEAVWARINQIICEVEGFPLPEKIR